MRAICQLSVVMYARKDAGFLQPTFYVYFFYIIRHEASPVLIPDRAFSLHANPLPKLGSLACISLGVGVGGTGIMLCRLPFRRLTDL